MPRQKIINTVKYKSGDPKSDRRAYDNTESAGKLCVSVSVESVICRVDSWTFLTKFCSDCHVRQADSNQTKQNGKGEGCRVKFVFEDVVHN